MSSFSVLREPDDVADGVDVRLRRLVGLVHLETAAVVRLEPGRRQIERPRRADTADGVEKEVGRDFHARLQRRGDAPGPLDGDGRDLLAETQRAVQLPEVERKRFGDLVVDELEEDGALVDDRDLDSERREHRGVFDADDSRAHDEEGFREGLQREDAVRVDHGHAVDGDGRRRGLRADRDHDLLRLDLEASSGARHGQVMGVREGSGAPEESDPVPLHLGADDVDLARDDLVAPEEEVVHRDVVLHGVGHAVDPALGDPEQVEDGFAERLGRDRPRVHADPAHHLAPLADSDLLAELRGLDGCPLPGRTRAEDEEIEHLHGRGEFYEVV